MNRKILYGIILFFSLFNVGYAALTPGSWIRPMGVPVPSFGTTEFISQLPSPWDATNRTWNNFVFYYICPQCGNSTDLSNPYGYPGQPRKTVPSSITGPAVVILGGQIDTDVYFTAYGGPTSPIFVSSGSASALPHLTGRVGASGSYVIFDYLWIGPKDASDVDFGFSVSEGSDHIVLRNSEITGNANRAGGVAVGTWSYTGTAIASNVVITDNYFHNIGDTTSTIDQDVHCIVVNGAVNDLWVTNNKFQYCSGDSMQVEAQAGKRNNIKRVYFGKNISDHNRQSGGWVKNATDVIFSQNIAHDFRTNSGGPGSCYGMQYDADNVWFIFNEAYNCNIGINIAGADTNPGKVFIIGNIIHDIISEDPTNPYNSGAMVIRGGTNINVLSNTISNYNSGINMPPGSSAVAFYNNIMANKTGSTVNDLYLEGSSPTLYVGNNVFPSNSKFYGVTPDSTSISANASFVSSNDFHLQSISPAVNKGSSLVSSVYDLFNSTFGNSITYDYDKNSRPKDSWEIGAYEYLSTLVSSSTQTAPAPAPSILNVNISNIMENSALVSWSTQYASSTSVQYGTSTSFGSSVVSNNVANNSVSISGLLSGSTYYLKINASNSSGLSTSTSTYVFTTATPTVSTTTPTPTPAPQPSFVVGARVQVINGPVNVRSGYGKNSKRLGRQNTGAYGTLLNGPVLSGQYTWWNVDYDSGVDGWSAQDYLQVVALANSGNKNNTANVINSTAGQAIVRTLYYGLSGLDVKVIQKYLIDNGYLSAGNITGYFGELTREAVRKFQCDRLSLCSGSEDTNGYGVVGPKTKAEITQYP